MTSTRMLSLPTVTALRQLIGGICVGEHVLGVRINTHATLDDFFNQLNIEVAREPSINKKIRATIDHLNQDSTQHQNLRRVIEQLADPRFYSGLDHASTLDYLNERLRGDGLEIADTGGGRFRLVSTSTNTVAAAELIEKADSLDLESVRMDFESAIEQAETKPDGAITAACSTVESVCKCILDEMGLPYPSKQDVKGLMGEVAKHLNLSPGRDDLPKEWEHDLKQILSGLFSVVGGIGALRTHTGDAHGRGKRPVAVDPRIAKLAIHAASTVSLFYIETWQRVRILSKDK